MPNTPHDDFRPDMDLHETLTPFDAMDQSGKRAMLLLILTCVFLLMVAFVIFKVYQPGVRDRNAPPEISAQNTPFKVQLENPGGVVTPDQDKEIYKAMDGSSDLGEITTAPTVEAPISMPKTANITVEPTAPVGVKPKIDVPKVQVQTTAPAPTPTPAPKVVESSYVVQVASVRTQLEAETLWNKLNAKHRNLLSSPRYPDIRRADLGDKGIFYRLRVAGLSSKSDATRLCDALKGRQQACFVAKK